MWLKRGLKSATFSVKRSNDENFSSETVFKLESTKNIGFKFKKLIINLNGGTAKWGSNSTNFSAIFNILFIRISLPLLNRKTLYFIPFPSLFLFTYLFTIKINITTAKFDST